MSEVIVEISQGIATVTLNRPKGLNAITVEDYEAFANALRDIDRRDDVLVTIWQATGKWFCAYGSRLVLREVLMKAVLAVLMSKALALLYPELLRKEVPVLPSQIGVSLMGDSAPYFPTSHVEIPSTVGVAKANEALLWGKKQTAEELVRCGFINKIFPSSSTDGFHAAVRRHLQSELEGLDPTALLSVKKLLRAGLDEKNNPDAVNLRESYAQSERFASGIPAERFGQIARREIRHKL
ncbi:ClpP/crotonase-like domain-containing protein [Armillaria fumosa]|nr:ClpP/crotonase-like domain-containing protein [Armillaria fumosa]